LPSHYNKNKHSFRGFLYASGAMLILYQTKWAQTGQPYGERTAKAGVLCGGTRL